MLFQLHGVSTSIEETRYKLRAIFNEKLEEHKDCFSIRPILVAKASHLTTGNRVLSSVYSWNKYICDSIDSKRQKIFKKIDEN